MLVEHRIHDVDERLVAAENAVPPGQQVALQPALAQVFAEHLHHPARPGEVLIEAVDPVLPDLVRDLVDVLQAVGGGLVRAEQPERLRVQADHVPQPGAEGDHRADAFDTGLGNVDGVPGVVRKCQRAQQQPAVGMRRGAHPELAVRGVFGDLRVQAAVFIEKLLGTVGLQPLLQLGQVLRIRADLVQRNLMAAPGALHLQPVDDLRPGPALGGTQHDHGPARRLRRLRWPGRRRRRRGRLGGRPGWLRISARHWSRAPAKARCAAAVSSGSATVTKCGSWP